MDSNNWANSVGVGEREGRVLLNMVRRRHFGLIHGIGRSGDIAAIQPKAAGSSVVNRLTNQLLLDWLRKAGAPSTAHCFLVPMATGMSLTLCLLTLRKRRPPGARFVLWPRIDQKSCFKCMLAAGLIPVPIELSEGSTDPKRSSECVNQLVTDLSALTDAIVRPARYLLDHWPEAAHSQGLTERDASRDGPDSVVCVLSTTLCFSPRVPDRLHAITKLCRTYGVSHLINNAYGVQSPRCMRMIESCSQLISTTDSVPPPHGESAAKGRVASSDQPPACNPGPFVKARPIDLLFVQSTDKNLLVPVGGAIIAGFDKDLVTEVAKTYPGRASATPSIDVLATLLNLGSSGWTELIERRTSCFTHLRDGLLSVAQRHGLRLLATGDNPISLALSLNELCNVADDDDTAAKKLIPLTQLGAQLFTQGCSGVRVVLPATASDAQTFGGYTFPGFGSHSSRSRVAYMNAAAAIGQTDTEVNVFLSKLDKVLTQFRKTLPKRDENTATPV